MLLHLTIVVTVKMQELLVVIYCIELLGAMVEYSIHRMCFCDRQFFKALVHMCSESL